MGFMVKCPQTFVHIVFEVTTEIKHITFIILRSGSQVLIVKQLVTSVGYFTHAVAG